MLKAPEVGRMLGISARAVLAAAELGLAPNEPKF